MKKNILTEEEKKDFECMVQMEDNDLTKELQELQKQKEELV